MLNQIGWNEEQPSPVVELVIGSTMERSQPVVVSNDFESILFSF